MPRIFDNIETSLLPALEQTLLVSERADFCVGYFNLRGWKAIVLTLNAGPAVRRSNAVCLSGCSACPQDELRLRLVHKDE